MYSKGDIVEYKTATIKTQNGEKLGQVKRGEIEEAFTTFDYFPCYWIAGEKELILGSQIIKKVFGALSLKSVKEGVIDG